MSNQGWSRVPSKSTAKKSVGEKVYDVVSWPFRKVFGFVTDKLLMKYGRRRK